MNIQGEATPSCKNVRLSAKVKVNDAEPVRFAADEVAALGIKSSSWDISAVADITCHFAGQGFEINSKCSSGNSLISAIIRAILTLGSTDGRIYQGNSLN